MAVRWIGGWSKPRLATNKNQMKVLITGGAGFLGTQLTKHFLAQDNEVVVASRDEAKHWKLKHSVDNDPRLTTFVWNAADQHYLNVTGILHSVEPDVIIMTHALKRIDVCEAQPDEALEINTVAVQRLLEYVMYFKPKNLKNVVLISTDKAANPISTYGTTKLLAEQFMRHAQSAMGNQTKFVVVRYGNVLDSTGSVIPYIKNRIGFGQPLQITDPTMTRFIFSSRDAVDMVVHMITNNESGLWIPGRIPSMNIGHLFELYSEKYSRAVEHGPQRAFPEKPHEVLNTEHEQIQWLPYKCPVPIRGVSRQDFTCPYQELKVGRAQQIISSEDVQITKQELKLLLERENLL